MHLFTLACLRIFLYLPSIILKHSPGLESEAKSVPKGSWVWGKQFPSLWTLGLAYLRGYFKLIG